MKVLVTGGSGFIGSHVVDEFTNNDFDLVVLDKDPIYSDPRPGEVRRIYLDVSHAKDLGWEPEIELEEGIRRVVEWLKIIKN